MSVPGTSIWKVCANERDRGWIAPNAIEKGLNELDPFARFQCCDGRVVAASVRIDIGLDVGEESLQVRREPRRGDAERQLVTGVREVGA
jgi:hypothetical protein